ncbi:hypothetical protein [Schinkia azotoformans]|uniref:hypothetical protein n=1 Tax=Schinkia azotoformans TaxID=1454 RepID=UPI002DB6C4B7|nr:hypothetical protein [Schinkia azotoformans]MEC1717796.1 hypothetical protein [Schinkia azotoformans]MEC1743572.1 hypothetical protein [Schinkia azotoformans]MEC1746554.1 hypothetical protein [Schinkia azotoformans]MEC1757802.1 hypothetical protein [Schinkia azotoformans]MEC1769303.1 hypothetical protein [Schinkia azotoformans]
MTQFNFDKKVYRILNNEKDLKQYIERWPSNPKSDYKKYQTIVFEDKGLGFIIETQTEIIAVYENKNPLLGRFIGECEILVEKRGGKKVPAYKVISLRTHGVGNNFYTRSLGKILLIANGEEIIDGDGYEAHHVEHSMINTYDTVKKVSKKENLRERPNIRELSKAIEYIKKDLLKTDDKGFEILLLNLQFLSSTFNKRKGIYVSGLNPTGTLLDENSLNNISIEVSIY